MAQVDCFINCITFLLLFWTEDPCLMIIMSVLVYKDHIQECLAFLPPELVAKEGHSSHAHSMIPITMVGKTTVSVGQALGMTVFLQSVLHMCSLIFFLPASRIGAFELNPTRAIGVKVEPLCPRIPPIPSLVLRFIP